VIPVDLAANVKELHEYMFEDYSFVPSQTVQTISDTVMTKTGVTEGAAQINTDDYNETAGANGTDSIKKGTEEN
jgi:hypothetical protein